jgi:hypothetical protein
MGRHSRLRAEEHYEWRRIIGEQEKLWETLKCDARQPEVNKGKAKVSYGEWDPERIYGHYACRVLRAGDRIVLTDNAGEKIQLLGAHLYTGTIGETIVKEILAILTVEPMTMEDLSKRGGLSHHLLSTCIGRLVKFGIIRPSNA